MNILDTIIQSILNHILSVYNLSSLPHIDIHLNTDENKQAFGDLSTNAALILSKSLGKNPRDIAQTILSTYQNPAIDKLEIAGPGFINIYFTSQTISELAQELARNPLQFFKPAQTEKNNYSVEFVSANPTGPLHVGHGRGGIIGDVLGNVLRFVGHDVTKEFYINDAGVQIVKLGASFKVRYLQALNHQLELPEDGYHGEYLTELAQECIQQYGSQVADKPDSFFQEYAKEHLLKKIKETLSFYGIEYDIWFSEKTLHDSGAITAALDKLQKGGFLYEAEGALWFKSTQFGDDKDRVVKKQSGELTYVAADIAYIENKIARGAQKLVMVLGQDHHSYVVRLKGIMAALGHNPDDLTVILYQLVTLKESGEYVRLSKRAGRIISLQDIITEVGPDVARFFYLNRKADAHLEFDLALALKHSDENPVYYIQYAYVRTFSMLEKAASIAEIAPFSAEDLYDLTPAEVLLLRKMISLQGTLKNIAHNFQTHVLTYYLYDLAHAFHRFYAQNRVIDPENSIATKRRLALVQSLQTTFKIGLDLLGLSSPQKM